MKAFIPILAVLWTSVLLQSCSLNRAGSLRMLDARAEYDDPRATPQELGLKEGGLDGFRTNPVPVRSRPKVAAIWIHPHEMASRDYFWGGWMSVVVEADRWVLTKPGTMLPAPATTEVVQSDAGRKAGGPPRKAQQLPKGNPAR